MEFQAQHEGAIRRLRKAIEKRLRADKAGAGGLKPEQSILGDTSVEQTDPGSTSARDPVIKSSEHTNQTMIAAAMTDSSVSTLNKSESRASFKRDAPNIPNNAQSRKKKNKRRKR